MAIQEFDKLVKNTTYPNAAQLFTLSLKSLDEVKSDAIFILDTNVLLVPYTASADSMEEIKSVFQNLKKRGQLLLPGQVAREFAESRPQKIGEILHAIESKKASSPTFFLGKYPLLDHMDCYKDMLQLESSINNQIKKYNDALDTLLKTVREWNWNDPVSLLYREIFTPELVIDYVVNNKEKLEKDLEYRFHHKIPPGYEDANKKDGGIGDLLIWLTILNISKTKKKPIVYVSGDNKADWFHQSNGKALYPRFELVNELYRESGGQSFHMIKLSQLLELMGADEQVISNVASEESANDFKGVIAYGTIAEGAVMQWYIENHGLDNVQTLLTTAMDFEVDEEDGRIAVAVFAVNRINKDSLREKLRRLFIHYNGAVYTELHIVLVTNNIAEDVNRAFDFVNDFVFENNAAAYCVRIICGYLTWTEKFIPTKTN